MGGDRCGSDLEEGLDEGPRVEGLHVAGRFAGADELCEAARASRPDCDEVILWNERGELTEASTANVALELGGEWVTPPVASGLLAGTFRNWLLAAGQIRERILTPADLRAARRIALINSVRKWQAAFWLLEFRRLSSSVSDENRIGSE